MVNGARSGLLTLRAALGRSRDERGVATLGLAIFDDEPTSPDTPVPPAAPDDRDLGDTPVTPAADDRDPGNVASEARQRQLYECAARARDRLAAVRPALARLRGVLPRPQGEGRPRDHDLIVLAAADVARGLVQARRSMRALSAELADLEAESRELLAIAASIEARR